MHGYFFRINYPDVARGSIGFSRRSDLGPNCIDFQPIKKAAVVYAAGGAVDHVYS